MLITTCTKVWAIQHTCDHAINHLIATLKPHSNEPSYSNVVIGTLFIDGWAFGTVRRGLCPVPRPLLAVTK